MSLTVFFQLTGQESGKKWYFSLNRFCVERECDRRQAVTLPALSKVNVSLELPPVNHFVLDAITQPEGGGRSSFYWPTYQNAE